jgi:hypothetical protein
VRLVCYATETAEKWFKEPIDCDIVSFIFQIFAIITFASQVIAGVACIWYFLSHRRSGTNFRGAAVQPLKKLVMSYIKPGTGDPPFDNLDAGEPPFDNSDAARVQEELSPLNRPSSVVHAL